MESNLREPPTSNNARSWVWWPDLPSLTH